MKQKSNAAPAGERTPANEKAPGVAVARGHKRTTSKPLNFRDVVTRAQGKQATVAFVADLSLHPAQQLSELFPNTRARMALDLAQAVGHQYVIAAGNLMTSTADALAMTLGPDVDADTLTVSVLAANARMRDISDVTAWSVMLGQEMRGAVSQALEATQS